MAANGNSNGAPFKITLRDLPLPVRLVLSLFLIGVGLGYFAALMQLHFQHAAKGQPLPTPNDMVEIFSGVEGWPVPKPPPPLPPGATKTTGKVTSAGDGKIAVKPDAGDAKEFTVPDDKTVTIHGEAGVAADIKVGDAVAVTADKDGKVLAFAVLGPPACKLESLIMGAVDDAADNGKSMAKPFFLYGKATEDEVPEREGERLAIRAWIQKPDAERRTTYENNAFPLPNDFDQTVAKQIEIDRPALDAIGLNSGKGSGTRYVADGKAKIKSIFSKRCSTCHTNPNDKGHKKLTEYADFADVLFVPKVEGSSQQMTVANLTQTTHLHLLSFCVLWTLTGVIFAFSSYWKWARCILAPLVLLAQILDVACWWLARLTDPWMSLPHGVGPYFALAIMGTGAVVAIGLVLQIVLSLLDMYKWPGRMVVLVLFIGAVVGAALLTPYVQNYLKTEGAPPANAPAAQ